MKRKIKAWGNCEKDAMVRRRYCVSSVSLSIGGRRAAGMDLEEMSWSMKHSSARADDGIDSIFSTMPLVSGPRWPVWCILRDSSRWT